MAELIEQYGNSTAQLLNGLVTLATPFVQQFAYGKDKAAEIALQKERNNFNALNGSGAVNPKLAEKQSPQSLMDFLFGSPTSRAGTAAAASGLAMGGLVRLGVLVGLAVGAIWFLRKL